MEEKVVFYVISRIVGIAAAQRHGERLAKDHYMIYSELQPQPEF